ncbi:MAG: hypothetical protein PHX83_13430 [Acidobacteriia bacterium]|nr:hypothetical protein [Terriglobia bacterium]
MVLCRPPRRTEKNAARLTPEAYASGYDYIAPPKRGCLIGKHSALFDFAAGGGVGWRIRLPQSSRKPLGLFYAVRPGGLKTFSAHLTPEAYASGYGYIAPQSGASAPRTSNVLRMQAHMHLINSGFSDAISR